MTDHGRDNDGRDGIWVGIDLGTQSVRALAVTRSGTVLGAGTRPLTSHRDGVRHEQDPRQWWQAVGQVCADALRPAPGRVVRGVAVDGTSGTVLLVGPDGEPLTPAVMYDDTRAAPEVERVNEVGHRVWAELGYRRMQPAWALPKVLWLLREYPRLGSGRGGVRVTHQNDYVNRKLVGHEVPADLSNALKTGAHLIAENWPLDVLEQLAVPASLLPGLVRPGTRLGAVCADAARVTGLPTGTPVISGMTDGCAAQLGAGALRVGSWNSVLG